MRKKIRNIGRVKKLYFSALYDQQLWCVVYLKSDTGERLCWGEPKVTSGGGGSRQLVRWWGVNVPARIRLCHAVAPPQSVWSKTFVGERNRVSSGCLLGGVFDAVIVFSRYCWQRYRQIIRKLVTEESKIRRNHPTEKHRDFSERKCDRVIYLADRSISFNCYTNECPSIGLE